MKNYNNFNKLNEDIGVFMDNMVNSRDNIDIVDGFIETGGDINLVANDYSLLMMAAEANETELVKHLLKKGANLNYRNKYRDNALYVSLINNHPTTTNIFISSDKLDLNKIVSNPILHLIAQYGIIDSVLLFLKTYPEYDYTQTDIDDNYFYKWLNNSDMEKFKDYPDIYEKWKKNNSIKKFKI